MTWIPYVGDAAPRSSGKIILADFLDAFLASVEAPSIAARGRFPESEQDHDVDLAVEFLGHLVQSGVIRSYSRPIGGGEVLHIARSSWELDDFRPRFKSSAFNPMQWIGSDHPTHYIFVDGADVAAFFAGWETAERVPTPDEPESLLRLPEVLTRVGVTRSTLYDWIAKARFPRPRPLGTRSVGWRASEIDQWVKSRGEGL